jgi:hypothetical protein
MSRDRIRRARWNGLLHTIYLLILDLSVLTIFTVATSFIMFGHTILLPLFLASTSVHGAAISARDAAQAQIDELSRQYVTNTEATLTGSCTKENIAVRKEWYALHVSGLYSCGTANFHTTQG